jgi:hypothetical protein
MVKKTEQLNDGPAAVSSSIQSTAASGPKPTSHLASSTSNRPHASFKPQIQNTSATANVKRPVPSQFQNLTRGSNGKFLPRSSNNGNSMAGGGSSSSSDFNNRQSPPSTNSSNNNEQSGGYQQQSNNNYQQHSNNNYQQQSNNNYGGGSRQAAPSYYPCGAPGGRMV